PCIEPRPSPSIRNAFNEGAPMSASARLLGAALLTAAVLAAPVPAQAAGETVNLWLTTTSDSAGRAVTRGLQQQTPISFGAGTGTGAVTINVDEGRTFQQFEGAGA